MGGCKDYTSMCGNGSVVAGKLPSCSLVSTACTHWHLTAHIHHTTLTYTTHNTHTTYTRTRTHTSHTYTHTPHHSDTPLTHTATESYAHFPSHLHATLFLLFRLLIFRMQRHGTVSPFLYANLSIYCEDVHRNAYGPMQKVSRQQHRHNKHARLRLVDSLFWFMYAIFSREVCVCVWMCACSRERERVCVCVWCFGHSFLAYQHWIFSFHCFLRMTGLSMPGMGECAAWKTFCKQIPNWPLCSHINPDT